MRGRLGSELQKIAVLSGCPYLSAFRHSPAGAHSVRELNKGTDVYPLDNDGGDSPGWEGRGQSRALDSRFTRLAGHARRGDGTI